MRNICTLYTDDSGVIDCFSSKHSFTLTFDSGSISIRLALNQTITSIMNAKNMIPAVVPACVCAPKNTKEQKEKN